MDKAAVMKLVKRGPHKTSCWAWRGILFSGTPTTLRGEYQDPALLLGATSGVRTCTSKLCVNPGHRKGTAPKPMEPPGLAMRLPANPKPTGKVRSLGIKQKQQQQSKASDTPPPRGTPPETRASQKGSAAPAPASSGIDACTNDHPQTPENVWTSPSTGKSKCKVCERDRKKATRERKKAAKR
jgi:hypothetical protein